MKTLKELLERRDALLTEYEELVNPVLEDDTGETTLDEDGETRRTELKTELAELEPRIEELEYVEVRKSRFNEARLLATAVVDTDEKIDMKVVSEPKTYGPGSRNSYFADFCSASSPMFRDHAGALERLARYDYEVSVEVARGSDEGKRAEMTVKEQYRGKNPETTKRIVEELREKGNAGSEAGLEQRTGVTTGASSGGSFVTPVYFVNEYAAYRKPGRAFVDQCNMHELPEYGVTVFLPAVLTDASVAAQGVGGNPNAGSGENTTISDTEPTAGYLTADLVTEAGQVQISQQILDRAGPDFQFDKLVFEMLTNDYNAVIDQYVLTKALAGAGQVPYSASAFILMNNLPVGDTIEAASFYSKVAQAKAKIRTNAGVVMDPTHLFVDPARWEYIAAQSDTTGRPLVVPGYANPYNAAAAGNADGKVGYEGATGYTLNGLPVFHDLNIPKIGNQDQAIVGALNQIYVWEGNLVPRVVPQTLAQSLTVLLQVYSYIAVIPRYPTAIQTISGNAMSPPPF